MFRRMLLKISKTIDSAWAQQPQSFFTQTVCDKLKVWSTEQDRTGRKCSTKVVGTIFCKHYQPTTIIITVQWRSSIRSGYVHQMFEELLQGSEQ